VIRAFERFVEARVRVAVLRARPGVKIWSAGHDVDELQEGRRDPLGWYDPLRRLVRAIENHPAPIIAMIERGVWGGACEAAMACDIVVCAPSATSALTPANLGVPYNVSGMLTFLNSASLRLIKEMALTAKPIPADRALHAGLVNHLMPEADLEPFTGALAADIVDNAPLSIAVMKEELRVLAGAHMMSPQGWERVQGLRRVVYERRLRRGSKGLRDALRERRAYAANVGGALVRLTVKGRLSFAPEPATKSRKRAGGGAAKAQMGAAKSNAASVCLMSCSPVSSLCFKPGRGSAAVGLGIGGR
jgi:methylmalonyl-CoA decarboxylase